MAEAQRVEDLSFEQALGELETIVKNLESGQTSLESAITSYEHGVALKKHCETKLREARAKIEKISIGADGSLSTQPLDQE